MKPSLLLSFILTWCSCLLAQDSNFVTIKTGQRVSDVLSSSDQYYYPEFTNAKVSFRDGSKGMARMNYNQLFDQMLYVDPKGDTLALADEKTIKFIVVNKDTFYYDEGYVRIVGGDKDVKLAEKQVWVVADIRKIGTHNREKPSVAIHSFTTYTNEVDAAKSKDLILNENIILKKETQFFFGNENNHFVRATKKKLLTLFPKDEWSIEAYLKENNVDFDKKNDLEKLTQFLCKDH
jgi:hypothetical protein